MINGTLPLLSLLLTLSLLVFFLALIVMTFCAIVDAARRPASAFAAARSSKVMWIALVAVFGLALPFIGSILAVIYLFYIRPRIEAVMDGTSELPSR
jgi:uncharacterized iron-regulated membrane protein